MRNFGWWEWGSNRTKRRFLVRQKEPKPLQPDAFLGSKCTKNGLAAETPMENIFNVKCLENDERYYIGLEGGQIGNYSV